MSTRCEEILSRLAENRDSLRRFGVRRIGLFGSAARGAGEPSRDLDFLVELHPKTFDAYMDLKLFLEGLFEKPVDLVLADALKPSLREGILRETVYAEGV